MQIIELFKALSDETRLRILNLLNHQNLCVCELVELLKLSQPKISKHIARLRSLKLVNTKRNEQFIYYSINQDNDLYEPILKTIFEYKNKILEADIKRLKQVETFVCQR